MIESATALVSARVTASDDRSGSDLATLGAVDLITGENDFTVSLPGRRETGWTPNNLCWGTSIYARRLTPKSNLSRFEIGRSDISELVGVLDMIAFYSVDDRRTNPLRTWVLVQPREFIPSLTRLAQIKTGGGVGKELEETCGE